MSTVINGVDYGPLAGLIGTWNGSRGLDIAPEPDGEDQNSYSDELIFTPSGPADNAEEQELVSLRYLHTVRKNSNGEVFHEQIGHWIYEAKTGLIMHSLSIPRGVTLLAGGRLQSDAGKLIFKVRADAKANDFTIAQSPFMKEKAQTKAFEHKLILDGNSLSYEQTTSLFIYGKDFAHKDASTLTRLHYAD
ncbi:heme-binding beta-barrel domain-containing protein [Agaribacterium sp. ZY112]|uniref:heme-binding beta-barrel domain-containing protein n=1 Tax=Agaribacterium sp. ZY112 TaxID=3233574 RepID=UPI003525B7BD